MDEGNKLIEERLVYIFANVNEWLRFAETKNAALLAFSGVCIFGLFQSPRELFTMTAGLRIGLSISLVLVVIALIICIYSFIPQLKRKEIHKWKGKEQCSDHDNLLYFGELCKYTSDALLSAVVKCYGSGTALNPDENQFFKDICDQIILNSKIALRKYKLFMTALYIVLAAVAIPLFLRLIDWWGGDF